MGDLLSLESLFGLHSFEPIGSTGFNYSSSGFSLFHGMGAFSSIKWSRKKTFIPERGFGFSPVGILVDFRNRRAVGLRFWHLESFNRWPTLDEALFGLKAFELSHHWDGHLFFGFGQESISLPWLCSLTYRFSHSVFFSLWFLFRLLFINHRALCLAGFLNLLFPFFFMAFHSSNGPLLLASFHREEYACWAFCCSPGN